MSSGARTHYRVNGNLNLSRAIGDLEYKQRTDLQHHEQAICSTPDVREQALQSKHDEFLLIACDGIWDVLTCQEACDFVREKIKTGMGVKGVCEALVDRCLAEDPKETQGIGADNMTCFLVVFEW
jgi:serine/threonine protein phosphatase PrpC